MGLRRSLAGVAAGLMALSLTGTANAQSEPFGGATITIYVGTGAGSTYDLYARLVSEHMGRHIAGNPNIIVQNLPGAGGAKAAAHLYNVAPKDGTALGMVQQNLPLFQALTPERAKFDMAALSWIGVLTDVASVIAVWHGAPATTLDGAKTTALAFGTTGRGSETYQVPTVMNALLGTKFKLVGGYKGVSGMDLAIEQGELHGRGGSLLSWTSRKPDWVRDGKVKFLVQIGLAKAPEIPSVPMLIDLAKDEKSRKMFELMSSAGAIGRSICAPPGLPADRLAILRQAFDATVADEKFLAEAAKRKLPVNAVSGAEIQKVVRNTVSAPKELTEELRTLLGL